MPTHLELIGRIALAGVFGSVIGFERNLHSRHVVLRTHIIVAIAAASFMVVSIYFAYFQAFGPEKLVEIDASRIAASVVSGIGFLAGGVILKSGATVQGLTTAASLWLATAVGLMSGSGMYTEGAAVAVMGVATLALLRRFEEKKEKFLHRKVTVIIDDEKEGLSRMMSMIEDQGVRVSGLNYERIIKAHMIEIKFSAHIPTSSGIAPFIDKIEDQPGVRQVKVRTTD